MTREEADEQEIRALLQDWRKGRVTGTMALNFSEGTLVSLDLREHRRVMHTRDTMSRGREVSDAELLASKATRIATVK